MLDGVVCCLYVQEIFEGLGVLFGLRYIIVEKIFLLKSLRFFPDTDNMCDSVRESTFWEHGQQLMFSFLGCYKVN